MKFNQRIMRSRGRILRSPMLNKPLYTPSIVCTCEPCYRSHRRVEISFSVLTLLRNCIRQLPWQLLYHLYNFEKSFLLTYTVILLPLHPAPMTQKNSQRCKIIHGMRPVGKTQRSINQSEHVDLKYPYHPHRGDLPYDPPPPRWIFQHWPPNFNPASLRDFQNFHTPHGNTAVSNWGGQRSSFVH